MLLGQRSFGAEGLVRAGLRDPLLRRAKQSPHHRTDAPELSRQTGGERCVLSQGKRHRREVSHAQVRGEVSRQFVHRNTGPVVDPAARDHPGLTAVHRGDRVFDRLGEAALGEQGELGVQDDTGGAPTQGRRHGVHAHPPLDPHRPRPISNDLLQQDERAVVGNGTAALVPLGDDPERSGFPGLPGLLAGANLNQNPTTAERLQIGARRDDDRRRRIGQPSLRQAPVR